MSTYQQRESLLILKTDFELAGDVPAVHSESTMLDAIRRRRSIGKMTDEVPSESLIRQVLEAGTWAPNHHHTEPWRFTVLQGNARAELGVVMGAVAAQREADAERKTAVATSAASKPLRSPVVIAIGVEPSPDAPEIEEISAVSAAAQNMLLTASDLGLAAIWRSGWIAFEPEVREFLGLTERGKVLGFIYLGYPAMAPPARTRRDIDEVTTWRS